MSAPLPPLMKDLYLAGELRERTYDALTLSDGSQIVATASPDEYPCEGCVFNSESDLVDGIHCFQAPLCLGTEGMAAIPKSRLRSDNRDIIWVYAPKPVEVP